MPRTELQTAAANGDLAAVMSLLEAEGGVGVNIKDEYGMSPLHLAALSRSPTSPAIIELLLEAGAEVNCRSIKGKTPLHYAAFNSNLAVATPLAIFQISLKRCTVRFFSVEYLSHQIFSSIVPFLPI